MAEAECTTSMEVSLEDFQRSEQEFLEKALAKLNEGYKTEITERLMGPAFRYKEKSAVSTAIGMIDNGDELFTNAESETDSDEDGCDETEEVNKISYEYHSLFSTTFLLIRAPMHKKTGGKTSKLCIEDDDKVRLWQYEHFCDLHPALSKDAPKSKRIDCSVKTYEEMKGEIALYFKNCACRSIQAVIVFNGHGGKEGLCLEGSPEVECERIPLDTVLNDVQKMLDYSRLCIGLTLPQRLQVIYAQCYAHLFNPLDRCDITVETFTDGERLKTPTLLKKDPLTKDVTDAYHPMLDEFAEEQKKTYSPREEKKVLEQVEQEFADARLRNDKEQLVCDIKETTSAQNDTPVFSSTLDTSSIENMSHDRSGVSTSSFTTASGGNLSTSISFNEDVTDGSLSSVSQIPTDSSISREISQTSIGSEPPVFTVGDLPVSEAKEIDWPDASGDGKQVCIPKISGVDENIKVDTKLSTGDDQCGAILHDIENISLSVPTEESLEASVCDTVASDSAYTSLQGQILSTDPTVSEKSAVGVPAISEKSAGGVPAISENSAVGISAQESGDKAMSNDKSGSHVDVNTSELVTQPGAGDFVNVRDIGAERANDDKTTSELKNADLCDDILQPDASFELSDVDVVEN